MTGRERERQLASLYPDAAAKPAAKAPRRPSQVPPARGGSYGAEGYGEAYDPRRRRWPDDATPPKPR